MAIRDLYDSLTEEQRARARSLTTAEELVAFAKEEGVELGDEQLEALTGGSFAWTLCPENECGYHS